MIENVKCVGPGNAEVDQHISEKVNAILTAQIFKDILHASAIYPNAKAVLVWPITKASSKFANKYIYWA